MIKDSIPLSWASYKHAEARRPSLMYGLGCSETFQLVSGIPWWWRGQWVYQGLYTAKLGM